MCMYEYEYQSRSSYENDYDNQSQVREPSRSRKRCYRAVLHAGWHEGSTLLLQSRKRKDKRGGKQGSAAIRATGRRQTRKRGYARL
jgi:hypothetical protein